MPTTVSSDELDELSRLLNDHIEETGETVSSLARRAGVDRTMVSRLRSGTYRSSPTFDCIAKVSTAIGKRLAWVDAD